MISIRSIIEDIREAISDDNVRFKLQYHWVYRILAVIAFFMTVVNVFTKKYLLMSATLIFGLICIIDIILLRHSERGMKLSCSLFGVEIFSLFVFFIVSGTPEGFSAIWICLLPACGILLFGRKKGSVTCAIMMAILIFFFWTPFGRSLLNYSYTDSFMMRFPMLYAAFYAVSMFLETIRVMTQEQMLEAQRKYHYMYLHDALTGIYSRYGFNEYMEKATQNIGSDGFALMILDLDYFKAVNDTYGHTNGDVALKYIATLLQEITASNGIVCRWGGEEFAILLFNSSGAHEFAEHIRTRIENSHIPIESNTIHVTASIGLAVVRSAEKINLSNLVKDVDHCLYSAKEQGRNRVVSFEIE